MNAAPLMCGRHATIRAGLEAASRGVYGATNSRICSDATHARAKAARLNVSQALDALELDAQECGHCIAARTFDERQRRLPTGAAASS